MKKYIKIFAFMLLLLPACSEDILDKKPVDSYSDPAVWSDVNLTKAYLSTVYDDVDWGYNQRGHSYQTGDFALECVAFKGGEFVAYTTGTMTPDNFYDYKGANNWRRYEQIQQLSIFLSHIDNVSDAYPESEKASIKAQTDVLKGEALCLRGLFYSELCRNYGGVPLFNKPFYLKDDFLSIKRASFEETVNFIVKDFDDAAQLLKVKSEMEMGRMTKETALAIKSRILLFAASDLTADGTAINELVGYSNPDRTALWTAARNAAKDLIDLGTCQLSDFGAPDQKAVAQKYFDFFKAYTLSDNEVIWGRMYNKDVGYIIQTNLRNGPNGNHNWGNNGPTAQAVDSYEMEDGSKFFDHFMLNANNEYINTSSVFKHENPYYNREPRFYATVLYDSAVWQPRFPELQSRDPLGIYDRRTRIKIISGQVVSEIPGIDTRKGPFEVWNGGYSGYLLKKFMDDKVIGLFQNNENINIYIRYAEIILNYAEASLELGDMATAATNINLIRHRAALPDFTGDITEALRHERQIELYQENIRWYDVRRWKILGQVLSEDHLGVDINEVNEDGIITTTWTRIGGMQASNHFVDNMYWIPIASDELKRAPLLIQNPGY